MHLLGYAKKDFRLSTSILLILVHKNKFPILLLSLKFEINYRGHFTKLEGRSADRNFTRVRTIDSAAGSEHEKFREHQEGASSAGVYNALKNSDFAIIEDIVQNDIQRGRIAKNCLSHFLCLLNTSSKRCLFLVPDTSMMPKKSQSEPSDFFRFLIPRTSAPPRVGLKCHDSIASIISEIRRTRSPSCFWTEVIWIFSSFSPRTIPAIAKSADFALRTVCPF